jgi:hypothetical protein
LKGTVLDNQTKNQSDDLKTPKIIALLCILGLLFLGSYYLYQWYTNRLPEDGKAALHEYIVELNYGEQFPYTISSVKKGKPSYWWQSDDAYCVTITPPLEYYSSYYGGVVSASNFLIYQTGLRFSADKATNKSEFLDYSCDNWTGPDNIEDTTVR